MVSDLASIYISDPADSHDARRVGSLAQAAELAEKVLSQHGQTVYEGDPSVPPDMDAIMATIASAIGIEPVRPERTSRHLLALPESIVSLCG